ncbi:Methylpurine-DNA glycosylase (MPG) [Trinorchestia longiramus]|nr:Methylpurine-DNA glycosylase (MPG) [Trinorchestia longiramus]
MTNCAGLGSDFFDQDCKSLARALLGQTLVRVVEGKRLCGRVVEVESYLGGNDVASHSHHGKRTPRNEPMYMQPGTAYVYSIYGLYYCFNISSKEAGSAVLIRSLEPMEGQESMLAFRESRRATVSKHASKKSPKLKPHQLCNGPSKLCIALDIDKARFNKTDLCVSPELFIEAGKSVEAEEVVECKRVGIESVELPWRDEPLRYYVRGCASVSVRDRSAEAAVNHVQGCSS